MTGNLQPNIFKNLKKKHKFKSVVNKSQPYLSKPLVNHCLIETMLDYYNQAEKHHWHKHIWYYGSGLHYSEMCDIQPATKQVCGGSFNNPYYENTLLFDKAVCKGLLDNIKFFPLVRSKITTIQHDAAITPDVANGLWHTDETPFEVLRVVVPLKTGNDYLFQLDNCEPVNLKVGMVYAFDQSVYHRVFKKTSCSETDRIHLILSYVTWFDKSNGEWIPNEYTGKVHPLDIFSDKINL